MSMTDRQAALIAAATRLGGLSVVRHQTRVPDLLADAEQLLEWLRAEPVWAAGPTGRQVMSRSPSVEVPPFPDTSTGPRTA